MEYSLTGLKATFTIALSLLRLVLSNLTPKPFLVEYHRDQLQAFTIQTGQCSQRKLIKCWNVTKSMGLTLFNIFNAINVCCSIWCSCFPIKPTATCYKCVFERNRKECVGWVGMFIVHRQIFFFWKCPPAHPPCLCYILPGLSSGSASLLIHRTIGPIFPNS